MSAPFSAIIIAAAFVFPSIGTGALKLEKNLKLKIPNISNGGARKILKTRGYLTFPYQFV